MIANELKRKVKQFRVPDRRVKDKMNMNFGQKRALKELTHLLNKSEVWVRDVKRKGIIKMTLDNNLT